ncbi:MAG: hypothetical protein MUC74_10150, partial [Ideonella sp.]|nr:hypothetical protein [Ideonella sp.]
ALTLDRYDAIRARQADVQPAPNVLFPIREAPIAGAMPAPAAPAPLPAPGTSGGAEPAPVLPGGPAPAAPRPVPPALGEATP